MQKRLWKSLPRKRGNYDSRQVQPVRINIMQAQGENWATPVVLFDKIASLREPS